jgi:hypothetical protein
MAAELKYCIKLLKYFLSKIIILQRTVLAYLIKTRLHLQFLLRFSSRDVCERVDELGMFR